MLVKTYHYTSLSNWETIKVFGYRPYLTPSDKFDGYFPDGVMGIWLWLKKPKGIDNAGNLIFQMSTKKEHTIVLLEVAVDTRDFLTWNGLLVSPMHKGSVGEYVYHDRCEARICVQPIGVKNIKLLKTFDISKLLG